MLDWFCVCVALVDLFLFFVRLGWFAGLWFWP